MKFEEGRQGTGYRVLTLFKSEKLRMDSYLIHYPIGSHIPPHLDKLTLFQEIYHVKHRRLNLIFKLGSKGGEFLSENKEFSKQIGFKIKDKEYGIELNIFTPNRNRHWVTEVEKGSRWVWSLGWLKQDKRKYSSEFKAQSIPITFRILKDHEVRNPSEDELRGHLQSICNHRWSNFQPDLNGNFKEFRVCEICQKVDTIPLDVVEEIQS